MGILQEMIEDLRNRENMFAAMLAQAQSQLSENEDKHDDWKGKLSKVASEIDASRRIISDEVFSQHCSQRSKQAMKHGMRS